MLHYRTVFPTGERGWQMGVPPPRHNHVMIDFGETNLGLSLVRRLDLLCLEVPRLSLPRRISFGPKRCPSTAT